MCWPFCASEWLNSSYFPVCLLQKCCYTYNLNHIINNPSFYLIYFYFNQRLEMFHHKCITTFCMLATFSCFWPSKKQFREIKQQKHTFVIYTVQKLNLVNRAAAQRVCWLHLYLKHCRPGGAFPRGNGEAWCFYSSSWFRHPNPRWDGKVTENLPGREPGFHKLTRICNDLSPKSLPPF